MKGLAMGVYDSAKSLYNHLGQRWTNNETNEPCTPGAVLVSYRNDSWQGGVFGTVRGALDYLFSNAFSNVMTTLGDIIYGGASGAQTRLPGDTSNTRKFLRGQASGGVAQAPAWDTLTTADLPSNTSIRSISYVIDGGGSAITTGSKGFLRIPFAGTITGWTILADQSGSIVVDIQSSTYAGFPTNATICGTHKPTLSSVQKNEDTAPGTGGTPMTVAVTAGDILEYIVDSVATVTRVLVSIDMVVS